VSVRMALVLVAILVFVVFLFFLLLNDVGHHCRWRLPLRLPRALLVCKSHQ
jgi:hypothetical protein